MDEKKQNLYRLFITTSNRLIAAAAVGFSFSHCRTLRKILHRQPNRNAQKFTFFFCCRRRGPLSSRMPSSGSVGSTSSTPSPPSKRRRPSSQFGRNVSVAAPLIDELQRITVVDERSVTEKVAKQKERVADSELVELSQCVADLSWAHDGGEFIAFDDGRVESALKSKEEGFQKVLQSAMIWGWRRHSRLWSGSCFRSRPSISWSRRRSCTSGCMCGGERKNTLLLNLMHIQKNDMLFELDLIFILWTFNK